MVGAGINTRDYAERVPALVEAGVDVLCIDSSEGYSEWQSRTIAWIREHYGDTVKVGAGNVVDAEGFRFLAEAGADFVKIGIGGGSICITRETKGIGRGQATAVIEVRKGPRRVLTRRPASTCPSAPTAASSTITTSRWRWPWARTSSCWAATSPASTRAPRTRCSVNGSYMKEYWGEGSNRARNWQRYDLGGSKKLTFEEGVDSYVPYAGSLRITSRPDAVQGALHHVQLRRTDHPELQEKAKLTLVSWATSIVEGGAHDEVQTALRTPRWCLICSSARTRIIRAIPSVQASAS